MTKKYINRRTIQRANASLMAGTRTPIPADVTLPTPPTRCQLVAAASKALAAFRAGAKATTEESSAVG